VTNRFQLSDFAFKFNLRRYMLSVASPHGAAHAGGSGMPAASAAASADVESLWHIPGGGQGRRHSSTFQLNLSRFSSLH